MKITVTDGELVVFSVRVLYNFRTRLVVVRTSPTSDNPIDVRVRRSTGGWKIELRDPMAWHDRPAIVRLTNEPGDPLASICLALPYHRTSDRKAAVWLLPHPETMTAADTPSFDRETATEG